MINTFLWAVCRNKLIIVKSLLKVVDPSDSNNYAIRWASMYGHIEVVKMLLADNRVDPSARDSEAIQHASHHGHTEIVKMLLADKRVDPSVRDNLAIYSASRYGYTEIVELLKNHLSLDKRRSL